MRNTKKKSLKKNIGALLCLGAFSLNAFGAESIFDLSIPESVFPIVAMGDNQGDSESFKAFNVKEHEEFKVPMFTGNKVHQYLGIGALALVALAAVSPKEEDGAHEYFATGSAILASAAVTTGLVYHWDDVDLSDGLSDPDNLHRMLAGLGALAMVAAVAQAPDGGHAGLGAIGGLAMGAAIKITW
ncbi:MAG: hypothetical protein JKY01_04120 [Pseudomonadales bacterium]|nr:hypothetical protein [Pseudomonadales bacterium]